MDASISVTDCPSWRTWVTPKTARNKPIHRWFLFPHSFTSELVHALIDEWALDEADHILDPFLGAGTTLLAAQELGIPAQGYDLSPLAVLASKTKVASLQRSRLEALFSDIRPSATTTRHGALERAYPELVHKALPDGRLRALETIAKRIDDISCERQERDFFRLALLSIIPQFSHAIANGGWLRWSNTGARAEGVADAFEDRVAVMLSDLPDEVRPDSHYWKADIADARRLPDPGTPYSAVIASPPYPNRHDYTRVFGIELMFAFLDWEGNRRLRHQTFQSHPEARPRRPTTKDYRPPAGLDHVVAKLDEARIQRMLRGYFTDMHLCLRELNRVCRTGAHLAFVVGNAQYSGQTVLVDEFTAELGENIGLTCEEIRAVRWRGNSAQQMGRFGRNASRESVVIFRKTSQTRPPAADVTEAGASAAEASDTAEPEPGH